MAIKSKARHDLTLRSIKREIADEIRDKVDTYLFRKESKDKK